MCTDTISLRLCCGHPYTDYVESIRISYGVVDSCYVAHWPPNQNICTICIVRMTCRAYQPCHFDDDTAVSIYISCAPRRFIIECVSQLSINRSNCTCIETSECLAYKVYVYEQCMPSAVIAAKHCPCTNSSHHMQGGYCVQQAQTQL